MAKSGSYLVQMGYVKLWSGFSWLRIGFSGGVLLDMAMKLRSSKTDGQYFDDMRHHSFSVMPLLHGLY